MSDKDNVLTVPVGNTHIDYHLKQWTSGRRGGGKVPADFTWATNPKQWQEENGANLAVGPVKEALQGK